MKTFTTNLQVAILFLLLVNQGKAEILTVSNDSNSPGQFTSLQDAINRANTGDTIYVSGSLTTYGTLNLNKQLTLVGAGYNPNNQYNLKSQLHTLNLATATNGGITTNPSGSKIMGFVVTSSISLLNNLINNIEISRNQINMITLSNRSCWNWKIVNNIVGTISCDVSTSNASEFLIPNNIITGSIKYFKSATIFITNNIFTQGFTFTGGLTYATITNNIFYRGTTANCCYRTFQNNISIVPAILLIKAPTWRKTTLLMLIPYLNR